MIAVLLAMLAAASPEAVLQKATAYALAYRAATPNYICTRTVTYFEANGTKLRKRAVAVEELTILNNQEHMRRLPGSHGYAKFTTEGEFIAHLAEVFNPTDETQFSFSRWEQINGHGTAVFDFSIEQEHSSMTLSAGSKSAFTAYHGTFWADENTGTVWRLDVVADRVPAGLGIVRVENSVEYGEVTIEGKSYTLPLRASIEELTLDGRFRNEIAFTNYHRFTADSTIRFDSGAEESGRDSHSSDGPQ